MADDARPMGVVEVRRVVDASPSTAFEAWTQREHVEQWWHPTATAQCTVCDLDLRVGGRYRLRMEDPSDGAMCEVSGEFLDIRAPERLMYTWYVQTPQGEVSNTLVEVEFRPWGENQTEVVVRHYRLPDTPVGEGHREGWEQMLASYARYVSSALA
jgi:uncharacterized protein YndB with AHSA1/START domain